MKRRIIFIFLVGIHIVLAAQTKVVTIPPSNLPFEDVHMTTDRDIYLSGETIWFSAVINLDQGKISKILYIELFNIDQKSIVRKKFRIKQGRVTGTFEIPSEFLSDTYFIRAYTHYNKNFSPDYYFMTSVQIINPRTGLPPIANKKTVNQTRSTNSYIIEPILPRNSHQTVLVYNLDHIENREKLFTLEILDNHLQAISTAEFLMSNKKTEILIPHSIFLNPGLHFYTLKDENKKIIKVQAFVYREALDIIPKLNLEETKYSKRDLISINLTDSRSLDFGIKVVQSGTVIALDRKLELYLNNPFLLISYLKNQFNPFTLNQDDLDDLLLKLNNKLNEETYIALFSPPKAKELKWLPETRDISLSGTIVDKKTQKPLAQIPIYLSVFREFPQIHIFKSRPDGSFYFSLNNYENSQDVFLCPLFEKTDDIELKLNREFASIFPDIKPIPLTIDSTDTELLEQMLVASQTKKVFKIESKKQDFSIQYLPYSFENPEISIVLDDYIETPSLEMVFKELVPNVRIRKRKDNYNLVVFDTERKLAYNNPLILVDNVPIFDIRELLKIPTAMIEKIEVHKSPFILGEHTINGIIMISTLTDNFGGMIMPKSSTFFEYQTLNPTYNFKERNYSSSQELNSRAGDFRTLLYWNPLIQGNTDQELNFYTSDQTGEYEIYIWGSSRSGQTFHSKLFEFQVSN